MNKFPLLLIMWSCLAQGALNFSVPEGLANDVEFWSKVYREWGSDQVVFYDGLTKTVYDVMDLPPVANRISSQRFSEQVNERAKNIRSFLDAVSENPHISPQNEMHKKWLSVVKENSLSPKKDLSERMHHQNGLREQFEYGLRTSGRYASEMKAVLRSQKVPEELLALVFVESLFYLSATSHAGASGPWGIMRETALRHGIFINKFTDERLDPVVSTWAAAQFLKKAYAGLGEWPLAIMAYNYGYSGMMRAKKNLATTDAVEIIRQHQSPIFGYASKNYLSEVLAALDTIKNQEKYFPSLKKDSAWRYQLVQVQRPVLVSDLYAYQVLNKDDLKSFNPALTEHTIGGLEAMPPDFAFRVPHGKKKQFYRLLKKIPRSKRAKAGFKISSRHIADGQQSLISIAKEHGICAKFLSDKMGKDPSYRPNGPVLIRSQSYLFSPILDFNKKISLPLSAANSSASGPRS